MHPRLRKEKKEKTQTKKQQRNKPRKKGGGGEKRDTHSRFALGMQRYSRFPREEFRSQTSRVQRFRLHLSFQRVAYGNGGENRKNVSTPVKLARLTVVLSDLELFFNKIKEMGSIVLFLGGASSLRRHLWNACASHFKARLFNIGNPSVASLCVMAREAPLKRQIRRTVNVDGRNLAPPKKPWNGDSPVNLHQQQFQPWFPSGGKMDFVHPQSG